MKHKNLFFVVLFISTNAIQASRPTNKAEIRATANQLTQARCHGPSLQRTDLLPLKRLLEKLPANMVNSVEKELLKTLSAIICYKPHIPDNNIPRVWDTKFDNDLGDLMRSFK